MSGANTLVWMQPPQLSSTNLWLGTSFYTDAVFRDIDDIQGAETSNVRTIAQDDLRMSFQYLLIRATHSVSVQWNYFK